ncbi:DUF1405 domain-containing protein [Calderihabitans maritimus]|uniref:DUF1405 domain-containing protein n=1 Tax=Calderihabitans maritimus TaxID=1246530 RepID=A0A1Z5HUV7_9FIRM|nr:DUF1405 domain-containing protein [Calderihabitans maritimus]GAW93188.1 hypothetical protein PTH_2725 [Calderihabitans maritimus]
MRKKLVSALRDPFQSWFVQLLLVINLPGALLGYLWYVRQLQETPFIYWPVVPDSPLSATFFSLTLLFWWFGKRVPVLELIAFCSVIKYGIWAGVIILSYWFSGGSQSYMEWLLLISHIGMALEGFIYLRYMRPGYSEIGLTVAWLAFNDLMDYGFGLHPYLFTAGQLPLALLSAVALTGLLAAYLGLLSSRKMVFKRSS